MAAELKLAWHLARTELRQGRRAFLLFVSILCLGVFALAAIGSFSSAARQGLHDDARALLGGDLELQRMHRPLSADDRRWLKQFGRLSLVMELRAMASNPGNGRSRMVEIKAVDGNYPLYGTFQSDDPQVTAAAEGLFAATPLRKYLQLQPQQPLTLGTLHLPLSADIRREPDRSLGPFALGPRLLLGIANLRRTGLVQPGSLVRYRYRLRLAPGRNTAQVAAQLKRRFEPAGWRLRSWEQGSQRAKRVLDRLDTNLGLLALTALLIGGIGISGAVRGYLHGQQRRIATLKALGASQRLIMTSYLLIIGLMALAGSLAGAVCGASLPYLIPPQLLHQLPVPLERGIYLWPLGRALLFGLLIALLFSVRELSIAGRTRPALLFRHYQQRATASRRSWLFIACGSLLLGTILVLDSPVPGVSAAFIGGALLCLVLFHLLGRLMIRLCARLPLPGWLPLRMAQRHLGRKGSPAAATLLALGLALTALVMIVQVQANLGDLVRDSLPKEAPNYFLLGLQQKQRRAFEQQAAQFSLTKLQLSPTLRGRILAINDRPIEEVPVDSKVEWALRSDRFLSYAADMPAGTKLSAGSWWPATWQGEQLLSLSEDLAQGFGVGVGDYLTVSLMGRPLRAKIANLRQINWREMRMNFALLFSPGPIERAPYSYLGAIYLPREQENALYLNLCRQCPNLSLNTTRDLFQNVQALLQRLTRLFESMAGLCLLSGFLVLAGAISADRQLRLQELVILKLCGAERKLLLLAALCEFALIGLLAGLLSLFCGSLAAMAIVRGPMELPFALHPLLSLAGLLGAMLLPIPFGLLASWRLLGQRPSSFLRQEPS